MGIMNEIIGNDNKLADKDVASDMLKDSKFGISALSMATSEAVNPQLRQMLDAQLTAAVAQHHQLSDMMIQKGWYPAYDNPQQQLKNSYQESQNTMKCQ